MALSTGILEVSFRILRGRNGILEDVEGFSQSFLTVLLVVILVACGGGFMIMTCKCLGRRQVLAFSDEGYWTEAGQLFIIVLGSCSSRN